MTPLRLAHANRAQPAVALLVDRDPDTRKMYAEYLKLSSCLIEEAEDGREALAKAISQLPDVIITETQLPGISGFDLCSLLRQDEATNAIPIVVVTGDAFGMDVRRAQMAGADAVLIKPCLLEALGAEIVRLLDQSSALRERARAVREKAHDQLEKSDRLIERSRVSRRTMLSRSHARHHTTTPPAAPPVLMCPSCDRTLRYLHSHIGGVSIRHQEQWDYFECPGHCGTFQYRERTRKLRRS
jgi:chemotaxis family two-component system response regulator PixH